MDNRSRILSSKYRGIRMTSNIFKTKLTERFSTSFLAQPSLHIQQEDISSNSYRRALLLFVDCTISRNDSANAAI